MGACCGSSEGGSASTKDLLAQEQDQAVEVGKDIRGKYNVGDVLGAGGSCKVLAGTSKTDASQKVAIKVMQKAKPNADKLFAHEVNLLERLDHPNIIKMLSHSQDRQRFYVVTRLCEGGELYERIVSRNYDITEQWAAKQVRAMLSALEYCHARNIVHRDVKPENFVFGDLSDEAQIVLIDFGIAKVVEPDKEYNELVGTCYYLAPELAAKRPPVPRSADVLKQCDIWAVGIVTYVMLTGRPPFGFKMKTRKEMFQDIVTKELQFPDDVQLSGPCKDFITGCLNKHPLHRLNMERAKNHPWVTGASAAQDKLNKVVLKYLKQFTHQARLKKVIARSLADHMHYQPEREIYKHFRRLDVDDDGFLDLDELSKLMVDLGYDEEGSKKEAQHIMDVHDDNHDNVIDFAEFKAAWQRKLLTASKDYVDKLFDVFDENGDGHIDTAELTAVLGNTKEHDAHSIRTMIAEVDANGDGKISKEEFGRAMREDLEKGKIDLGQMYLGDGEAYDYDQFDTDGAPI